MYYGLHPRDYDGITTLANGRLPLRVAFGLVLSADEQEEVGLEAFVEDVRGFLENDADDLTLEQAFAIAMPANAAFVHEMNRIAGFHHAVHVVGNDHRCNLVFSRDIRNEVINDDGCLWV